MSERTKLEQILILDTLIKERESIISNIKDDIKHYKEDPLYVIALKDQIVTHQIAISKYKEGLNKLKH